jgi:hypothetical protein
VEKGPMPDKALEAFKTLQIVVYLKSERTFFLILYAASGTKEERGCLGTTDEKGDHRVIS